MGQKVNPISNRLGIIRGWDSNWYGGKNYGDSLLEDSKIRKYLNARLAKASVSRIVIERTLKLVTITVCTARPGIILLSVAPPSTKILVTNSSPLSALRSILCWKIARFVNI